VDPRIQRVRYHAPVRHEAGQQKGIAMKKLIILLAVAGVAVFAFSKVFGSKEEHEFGA
jgi:hypothetical protein